MAVRFSLADLAIASVKVCLRLLPARARVIDEFQVLTLVEQGWITGPDGKRYGSTGIVVNCPILERL